ncbi:MAG TPA: hypothetical protein HPP77_09050 [Candidatus Hydrogenedentes bacterium]|nr:hypothetical protein [Candidatus Hydrogenedentota bacterium]HIJ73340.1 hypothetical protein [Candidatus Hydrogenedentota bacterium]
MKFRILALVGISAFVLGCARFIQAAGLAPARNENGVYHVQDFGASGDGEADDTAAFQAALDKAGAKGGGVVKAGVGQFRMKGHLVFPSNVTLEGIWRAPARGVPFSGGTVLMPTEGKGEPEGTPFIKLNTTSTLKGVTIFYPEQVRENPPHAYPWTVQGEGDNCSIVNVTMVNPYQAVDFGSLFCGRHYINGLYAQALYRGLFIDQCYDVGRIENVHFWPFWTVATSGPLFDFTEENGIAFMIARTDGEMGVNLFQIFYNIGFYFTDKGHGGGSGMYTNVYSDVSPLAMKVDATHGHAPVTIVNGSFMTAVDVAPKKQCLVNFVATGFWSIKDTRYHAKLEGPAQVTFDACSFYDWDRVKEGHAAIESNCESIIVSDSQFIMKRPGLKVRLGKDTKSAIIASNRMRGGIAIENNAKDADVQIGLNTGR